MPIYDYMCQLCEHCEEMWLSISTAEPVIECPKCKQSSFTKTIIQAASFRWGKKCSLQGVYDKSKNREKYQSEKWDDK